jgi:chemotaxis response regulator CheB
MIDHLRVLIIDDSLTIRAMLEKLVQREAGCRVVGVASNAAEARSMMIDLIPNVVTLDLNMPGIDGMAFLDEVRQNTHPPIVVVSSATTANSEIAVESIRRGAYASFDKSKILVDTPGFMRLLIAAAKSGNAKPEPDC